ELPDAKPDALPDAKPDEPPGGKPDEPRYAPQAGTPVALPGGTRVAPPVAKPDALRVGFPLNGHRRHHFDLREPPRHQHSSAPHPDQPQRTRTSSRIAIA